MLKNEERIEWARNEDKNVKRIISKLVKVNFTFFFDVACLFLSLPCCENFSIFSHLLKRIAHEIRKSFVCVCVSARQMEFRLNGEKKRDRILLVIITWASNRAELLQHDIAYTDGRQATEHGNNKKSRRKKNLWFSSDFLVQCIFSHLESWLPRAISITHVVDIICVFSLLVASLDVREHKIFAATWAI